MKNIDMPRNMGVYRDFKACFSLLYEMWLVSSNFLARFRPKKEFSLPLMTI